MKRATVVILLAAVLAGLLVPLAAAERVPVPPIQDRSPAAPVAHAIAAVTGIAISPLLGTGVYGAWHYYRTAPELRVRLPWFAQPMFFVPALLIVGICAVKDSLGAIVPPPLKKPLDVLETVENQLSALVAAGAVIPLIISTLSQSLVSAEPTAFASSPLPSGLAMIHLANANFAPVLTVLLVPVALAAFGVVWMVSHAITVLILLSPWGAIDTALKSARTALLGVLAAGAFTNPWLGAALAVGLIVTAYFLAGWAFRLTLFGSVFSWDFLTARRRYFTPGEYSNAVFTGPAVADVPVRSYGRLERVEGGLQFVYRPWLFGAPQTTALSGGNIIVGKGLFFSALMTDEGATYFILPPRYTGHEEELVRIYGFGGGVRPAGLRKAWSLLRELLGGAAAQTQVV